jgi:hypothetical protein
MLSIAARRPHFRDCVADVPLGVMEARERARRPMEMARSILSLRRSFGLL